MNRFLVVFALDSSSVTNEVLDNCKFHTPYWQPDNHGFYVDGGIAMSATQRFITPQCKDGLMPYQHKESGCVINADVYLTNRDNLCKLLESDSRTSDIVLILQAYLKWGEKCTKYLAGHFGFMIWDPRYKFLFVAVDQFAQCPLFYLYQKGKICVLANEFSPFNILYSNLTLNEQCFLKFANDEHSETETAYREVRKLPAGYQLVITSHSLSQKCYWNWKNSRQTMFYRTREQYYFAFQEFFTRAVKACLRRLGPLTSQLSGGLDSSAVTAQAALLLTKQQKSLFAFTSVPNELTGESYRHGWYYNELFRIEELLSKYPNIEHVIYKADPSTDIFKKLKPLQSCFDRPLRNINNLDWTLACYEQVLLQNGRVLLIGAAGNGTISWEGSLLLESLKKFCAALKAKILRRKSYWIPYLHEMMLSGRLTEPLRASVYPLQLWYGVRRLDPTQELNLAVFCYNVPRWIYCQGKQPLQRRMLVREGLRNILPNSITQNPYRGEQGADWYLHYNLHCEHWRQELLHLSEMAQQLLWKCYDREKVMSLFDNYKLLNGPPDREIVSDLCIYLLRCLSVGFYLNDSSK